MQKAFSLVELSIVLVILGLLTGGILAGQSLIRAAELRGLVNQFSTIHASLHTFRDKYMALPGDMRNATQFWGTLAGDGTNSTCQAAYATAAPTCNGDGNGWIRDNSVQNGEVFRAWQHMANAGLINGAFTGRNASENHVDPLFSPGVNVPAGKLSRSMIKIIGFSTSIAETGDYFFQEAGHRLELRQSGGNSGALVPEEAWNIDVKLDDGKAITGFFFQVHKATGAFYPGCVTTDIAATAEYALNSTSKLCSGQYKF